MNEKLENCNPTNSSEDIWKKCRLCLDPANLTSMSSVVFMTPTESLSCNDILRETVSLQLKQIAAASDMVCIKCVGTMANIYAFKKKIQESETYLNSLLAKITEDNLNISNDIDISKNTEHSSNKCDHLETNNGDNKLTNDLSDYLQLKKSNCKQDSFPCSKCNASFYNESDFNDHLKSPSHLLKLHSCAICGKKFRKSKLSIHIRSHTKEKPYACRICDMKFSIMSNLNRHLLIHTGKRKHRCNICGKGFIQSTSLQLHQKTHINTKSSLMMKVKPLIQQNQMFHCKTCGVGFKRLITFQAHLKTHDSVDNIENPGSESFKCDICNKEYPSKNSLYQHKRVHSGNKYLCPICGKVFNHGGTMRRHHRAHSAEPSHKCAVCEKTFSYAASLAVHALIHRDEKPHACADCGKRFRQSSGLKAHRRLHTGEKPYGCTFCPRRFTQKPSLTAHLRVHTGELPFECAVCSKRFAQRSNLKGHARVHARESERERKI